MAHDVFISYSARDKSTAEEICSAIEKAGRRCWIAPRDILPGATWGEAIVNAIQESQVMVLVLSSQSNGSPQVLNEVERAMNKGVKIIPFRIEEVTPSDALGYYISARQWLDAFTPPLETHIHRLVETLASKPDIKEAPEAPAAPRKNNLPSQLTSFIGREKELNQLHDILTGETARLVTLTGPGGTGKTRLALKAAEGLLETFPDGVYLVELAPLSDPALVLGAVATVLGLRETPGRSVQEAVAGYLENKHLLLILDNCEHLVEECARLADWLLKGSPGLKLLATSREILGVGGETSLRVPPLELPDARQPPGVGALAQVEAVRLFVERARQAAPGFVLDESNANAVVQVCQRLDGIPLALELAAARLRMMTVQQVTSRLGDVFRLLTGGSRSALPRQQTLKAAMDWSYALLTDQEKLALQRLSVFARSWTLEGAEAVCAGNGIEDFEVLDLLGSLVDKSLAVRGSAEGDAGRFRMLETVRQYAHDRLLESGEGSGVRDRHLEYYLKLSEIFAAEVRGKKQIEWLDRMEGELDNLRLALEWSLAGHIIEGLRLASALMWFWRLHAHNVDGIMWLEKLLAAESVERGSQTLAVGVQSNDYLLVWVRASCAAVGVGGFTNEIRKRVMKEAIALCRELGEVAVQELAWSLQLASGLQSSTNESRQYLEESLDLCRQKSFIFLYAFCLNNISDYPILNGQMQPAILGLEESLAIFRQIDDPAGIASCLSGLTYIARFQNEYARAYALRAEVQEYYCKIGYLDALNDSYIEQLYNALEMGEDPKVFQQAERALNYFKEIGNIGALSFALMRFSEVEWARGNIVHSEELARETYELNLEYPDLTSNFWIHYIMGRLSLSRDDLAEARNQFTTGLSGMTEENETPFHYVFSLSGWVVLLVAEGKMAQAVKVYGALDETYKHFAPYRVRRDREELANAKTAARQALDEEAFSQAWKAGKELSLWQALQLAQQEDE
jgi:predicted ATPase